jgi:hypothetical protein
MCPSGSAATMIGLSVLEKDTYVQSVIGNSGLAGPRNIVAGAF